MKNPITSIKDAFRLFISTVQKNTAAVQALAEEQKILRAKFDALVDDSRFMVRHKKAELQRAGHSSN